MPLYKLVSVTGSAELMVKPDRVSPHALMYNTGLEEVYYLVLVKRNILTTVTSNVPIQVKLYLFLSGGHDKFSV